MPTVIDYKNLFMSEKGSKIEEFVGIIQEAKNIYNSESAGNAAIPVQTYETSYKNYNFEYICYKMTNLLNDILTENTCAGVTITNNNDNTIFGVIVNPTVSNVDLMSILLDTEEMSLERYQVEIDTKLFRVLEASELASYILYNIECTMSTAAIEIVRNHIAYILNKYGADIDIKSSINYSNILIFGVKDTIARHFDLISGIHEPEVSYLVYIRNKLNSHLSELTVLGKDPNMSILDWCLSVYKDLKTEYKDAVERLKMAKQLTGSKLRKDEIDRLIKSLERASQESITEATVRQELREAKGLSLFKGLKQNGLRSIEEDLYEYKVRAKNCTEQEDAIYILRCINTRIAILEDYLSTTPDISAYDVERWRGVINNYRELRAYISSKKFRSASANFNSFLNIDYDALDKLDPPQYESALLEGKLNQVIMGTKIKPHQDIEESCKKGSYPGLLNFVKKCDDIEDLKYLKKDTLNGITMLNKVAERIQLINQGKGKPAWEAGIKKKYIDKGVTYENLNGYINWLKEVLIPVINDRIKELKSLKEAALLEADEEENTDKKSDETGETKEDEGFKAADDSEDTQELSLNNGTESSEDSTPVNQDEKDMRNSLPDSEIKSDGGNIYVNCTINTNKE